MNALPTRKKNKGTQEEKLKSNLSSGDAGSNK